MTAWTKDQLDTIDHVDEIEISSRRADGSLTAPRVIWAVRDGDDVYIRSVNGPTAAWYRATRRRHEGRLHTDGLDAEVTFADADGTLADRVDAAYRRKYRRYAPAIIDSITGPQAVETTMRVEPAEG